MTIVDTHTHFYDPGRPGGVPWPPENDPVLYRQVLPKHCRALAEPLGVVGTVVVEASPWVEDNQWMLDLAAGEPFIFGFIGNLSPGAEGFRQHLARFAANPVFRGIRIPGSSLAKLSDGTFVDGLRDLAGRGLALDIVLRPEALPFAALLAETIAGLRIILDHVAEVRIDGTTPDAGWSEGIRRAAGCSNVWCKVSGLVEATGQRPAPADTAYYAPTLDALWKAFGEDRLVYGSNWPVCELFSDYATVQGIAQAYFAAKGEAAAAKVLAENAHAIYRWPA